MEKKYPNFYKETGYGTATGLCGINCRHSFHPYYEGSARAYEKEQLEKWKNEKVIYNGKEYSRYDASQLQRAMERQIRSDKKELAGLQGILTSGNKDSKLIEDTKLQLINKRNKLKQHNATLDDFVKQTNTKKDYTRLYVGRNKSNIINNKEINNSEKYALNSYISAESYKINETLRNNTGLSDEQKQIINNLDNALNKCKKYNGNVVRVLDIRNKEDLNKFIQQNQKGQEISFKEYLSFSDKNNYNKNANVIIYTTSKNGRDIRKYNPDESEILYSRNSKFLVENIIKKDNTYYILWRDINE